MKKIAGINGFGRFGLHLIKYWLDRAEESSFSISYINDDFLNIDHIHQILLNDKAVFFNKYKIKKIGSTLRFLKADGTAYEIVCSNSKKDEIPWLGEPDIFFECSGKNTMRDDSVGFLKDNTKTVVISATSWDPDKTLVYGFNHEEYTPNDKIISYGSCTVNAYVPLSEFINQECEIIDSDVNVIHNIQEYVLDDNLTLNRKFCTLEKSAVQLLDFVTEENFVVNYTVIPYTGVSMIDFRFRVKKVDSFTEKFEESVTSGSLKGLYGISDKDRGPEVHNCTPFSSVIIREGIKIKNNNIYLPAYFDNENSVNRYYDLVNFISAK